MSYHIEDIRRGESTTFTVPRTQRKKLWQWCLKHAETGRVNVTVLNCRDYSVREHRPMQRMPFQAVPSIRTRSRFDYETGRNRIAYSDIYWEYVQ